MRIADGLAGAVDKMVVDVEYRDSIYFSSERLISRINANVDDEKSSYDLRRLKLERRELKKKLRKEGDEKPDLKKLTTIDRATAALMAADAVLDNEKKRNIQDSSESDSNLSSDERAIPMTSKEAPRQTERAVQTEADQDINETTCT